ncbi:MAG: hypothetical protein KGJ64_00065 [Betaproteobacteria bacterium]|nr:hypothetical protein [Betaproteobacteria bacterium]
MTPPLLPAPADPAAPRWLASVTDAREARMAHAAGVDVIDAKDPRAGPLGALPPDTVHDIRAALGPRALLSATTGDLVDMPPRRLAQAAGALLEAGVDVVKIALYPAASLAACIDALAPLAQRHAVVGVLLADRLHGPCAPRQLDALLARLAAAHWRGVVLDTADKTLGPLPQRMAPRQLRETIDGAHRHGLLCGLAGSLRVEHIGELAPLRPDLLGFRGALCNAAQRTAGLDAARVAAVAAAMRAVAGTPARAA